MEKISLRDPMRSDTFTRPSAGHSCRIVGPTRPRLQDDFQNIPAQEKNAGREKGGEILANRSARRGHAPAWETRSGSRGLPCCESSARAAGTRTVIGKDKSYLRVERRSVITHPPIPAAVILAYPRFHRGVPLTRFTQTPLHRQSGRKNRCACAISRIGPA